MFIQCERLMNGPGPSDVIVGFQTADGRTEEVVVHKTSLSGNLLEVAVIVNVDGKALIELPRESASGQSRVWVLDSQIQNLEAAE